MTTRLRHAALLVVLTLLGGLVVTVLGTGPAAACSCISRSDANSFDGADAVFSGTVVDGNVGEVGPGDQAPFTITVAASFKGPLVPEQTVTVMTGRPTCGTVVATGDRILVFASERDGVLGTSTCSMNRNLGGPTADAWGDLLGPVVACTDAIDAIDTLPADFRPVAGAVALTPGPIRFDATAGPPYFAKEGIGLRSGNWRGAVVTVPRRFRDRVSISWGQAPPGPVMRFEPCVTADGTRWLAFAGGFTVTGPVCVPLVVTSGKRTGRIRVAIGRECSRP